MIAGLLYRVRWDRRRERFRPWVRKFATWRLARMAARDPRLARRCTVHHRVCMEEAGLAWQDCPMVGCGPAEVV